MRVLCHKVLSSKFFLAKIPKAKESSRFVSVGCSLDEFVQDQENKNTSSKTQRDVSSLKTFLISIFDLFHVVFLDRSSEPLLVHSPFELTYCTVQMCLKLCFSQCCLGTIISGELLAGTMPYYFEGNYRLS